MGSSKEGLLNLAMLCLVASFESSKGCNGSSEAGHAAEHTSSVVEPSRSLATVGSATVLLLEHDSKVFVPFAVISFSAKPGPVVFIVLVTLLSPFVG